jgi:hypothetical protein
MQESDARCVSLVIRGASCADRWGGIRGLHTRALTFLLPPSLPILTTTESLNMLQASYFEVHIRNTETKNDFDEHQIKTTDKQTECYIESRAGEKFEIFVKMNRATQPTKFRNSTYRCRVYVDGQCAASRLLGTVDNVIYEDSTVRGMELSRTEVAPFVFGQTVFTGIIQLKPLFTSCREWTYG